MIKMFFFTLFENAEDHVVLFDSLNANGVHAVLTAQVASVEPIALDVFVLGDVAAQKVPVTVALPLLGSYSRISLVLNIYHFK